MMMNDDALRQELAARIAAKQVSLQTFVRTVGPRGARLNIGSIVCSALASALTAGPAIGGVGFTESVKQLFGVPDDALVWRGLCLVAMILSIGAAITTNLYNSNNIADRLNRAQAGHVALEGLEAAMLFEQIATAEAAKRYQQCLAEIPFIHD